MTVLFPAASRDLLDEADPKRAALQPWLDRDVRVRFAGRLLAFDDAVAERWGQLEAPARRPRVSRARPHTSIREPPERTVP